MGGEHQAFFEELLNALPDQSVDTEVGDFDTIVLDVMKSKNICIGDLVQVHHLWPSSDNSAILSPFSPYQIHNECSLETTLKENILKLISMVLLIEYYSRSTNDGSSFVNANVNGATLCEVEEKPKFTRVEYLNDQAHLASHQPMLVKIVYFSNDDVVNDSIPVDLTGNIDDDRFPSFSLQSKSSSPTTKKKPSTSKKKRTTSYDGEVRKSFRDTKEPTDPYLKALDKEGERKQTTKTTRRSSKQQKVHSKKQKTDEDFERDFVEDYIPQISQSSATRSNFSVKPYQQLLSPDIGVAANISLHNEERASKNAAEPVISMVTNLQKYEAVVYKTISCYCYYAG
jgi:hypothetical protein